MKNSLRAVSMLIVAGILPACGGDETTIIQQIISNPSTPPGGSGGFDPSATVTSNPSGISDEARRIAVDANFMYILGFQSSAANGWRIEKRSLSDGSLDPAFGTVGFVTHSVGGSEAFDMAIDATDLYVVGSQAGTQWRIEKRNLITGALVTTFDGDGVVNVDPSGSVEEATAIALDATSVYVAGTDNVGNTAQWRVEKRSKSNGGLDIAFNGTGVLQVNPSGDGNIDRPLFLRVSGTSLFAAGLDQTVGTGGRWRIDKRNLSDGTPVVAFDGDGVLTVDLSGAFSDLPTAFAASDTAIFIGGRNQVAANWRVEKRSATTGAPDTAFDTDGAITGGGSTDVPFGLLVDANSLFIGLAMRYFTFPEGYWRIEKRDVTTGALDADFGIAGVVISDPSPVDDGVLDLAGDATFIYAAGFDSVLGGSNRQWRIEKRYK